MGLNFQGMIARLKASVGALPDGNLVNLTTDAYGRLHVDSITGSDHVAAADGSYFVGSSGVAGSSAVIPVGPASAVPADTTPFFLMSNTASPSGTPGTSPSIWLKRLYFLLSGTQTSETGLDVQGQLDQGLLYTSGGTKLGMANQNPLGAPAVAVAYHGAITKAAKTGSVIYCGRAKPRTTIPVAGDAYLFKFGASEGPSSYLTSAGGAGLYVCELGPVVIPPGWTFSLHAAFGAASTGAPAIETETGHIER